MNANTTTAAIVDPLRPAGPHPVAPRPDIATRWVRTALPLAATATFVGYAALIARGDTGEDGTELAHVLFNLPFGLAALGAAIQGRGRGLIRWSWRFQALGTASWLVGSLYALRYNSYATYPSPADALWLSFYVFTAIALVLRARAAITEIAPIAVLDGAVVGAAAAAVAAAFVVGPLLEIGHGRLSVVATNLAYPVADLLILALIASTAHFGSPGDWSRTLTAGGLALFFIGDCFFLYGIANDTWTEGTPLELLWIGSATLLSFAAAADRPFVPRPPKQSRLGMASLATVVAIGILVYGQWSHLSGVAIGLAVLAVALSALRVQLSVRELRTVSIGRRATHFDHLTELPNRRHLIERIEQAFKTEGQPVTSLLVLDLHDFRQVNDSLGHRAGDQLLKKVGQRLAPRSTADRFVARIGGDEFAVFLSAANTAQALDVAAELQALLAEPFNLAGIPVVTGTSVGVASSPEAGSTASELISKADIAMYQAKARQASVSVFRSDEANPSRDRLALMADLRAAFERNEIVAHFQPQIDLRSGQAVGAELLARWDHPTRGVLMPGAFLGFVVEAGLMPTLTRMMLEQAAEASVEFRRIGRPIRLSVNVSAFDLADETLPGDLEERFSSTGTQPGTVTLEITEDAVLIDRAQAIETLSHLRRLGPKISVDDYGVGQASLSYLRDLPLDELKLDRSFVHGAVRDLRSSAIAGSTIELAHDLGLTVVAEGVEDAETSAWLQSVGCDVGQGYYYNAPMPLTDLVSWIGAHPAE